MRIIKFTVYGDPKPQQRHRHFRRGSFTQTYDPSKKDKTDFTIVLLEAKHKFGISDPIEGAIEMKLAFYFDRPKSHYRTGKYSKELKPNAPSAHIKKPDGDNLVKFVLDSMNKFLIKDDSQVYKLTYEKFYVDVNSLFSSEDSRTEIEINFNYNEEEQI